MNVTLSKFYPAIRTLPVPVMSCLLYTLLAKQVRTCLQSHLPFPVPRTTTHYLTLVLLQLQLQYLVLWLLYQTLQPCLQLSDFRFQELFLTCQFGQLFFHFLPFDFELLNFNVLFRYFFDDLIFLLFLFFDPLLIVVSDDFLSLPNFIDLILNLVNEGDFFLKFVACFRLRFQFEGEEVVLLLILGFYLEVLFPQPYEFLLSFVDEGLSLFQFFFILQIDPFCFSQTFLHYFLQLLFLLNFLLLLPYHGL